jgi:hypothetical protein
MGGLDWSDISMRWTSCMSREIILVGCSCLDIIDEVHHNADHTSLYRTVRMVDYTKIMIVFPLMNSYEKIFTVIMFDGLKTI